ncbi:MAG: helix-turn-helix domain-containing protein [Rickettsiales bacterium]|nr:helix-turn-helix domain-containing protein [Rickettsiales bacterium]
MQNNVKRLRIERGLSLSDVARAASTTPAQIQKLERGERRLTDTWLYRLSNALQCLPAEILLDHGFHPLRDSVAPVEFIASPACTTPTNADHFIFIPLYDDPADKHSAMMLKNPAHRKSGLLFDPLLLRDITHTQPTELALIRHYGDAMNPTISESDLLMIDPTQSLVQEDGIYALNMKGRLVIRRLQQRPHDTHTVVISDNKDYPPYTLDTHNGLELIGKIIWISKKL